jgi:hypothetical protein
MSDGIFSQFERDELNKITAKSILEKLMNIRQSINVEFTARRLVWELMQNAKDNANLCNELDTKVDVSINLEDDKFIFTHNNGFFTNEHIRGLIRKYSSSDKDRDILQNSVVYKTTGRFGTGFMTTHLLSETVQVNSLYKNDQGTFNKFDFWIDRSGKNEKGIIQGINNSFDEAEESIKKSESLSIEKQDFQTSFTYPLDEKKRKLALTSLTEVETGIAYTLINVTGINVVNIKINNSNTSYTIGLINTKIYDNHNFNFYNLNVNGVKTDYYFIAIEKNETRIIIPISIVGDNYYALPLDYSIPRLHLDFPLIGTEDLNLPFIINSPLFEPTEPRDGVSIMGDENIISKINCDILLEASELYKIFLNFIDGNNKWKNLYNIAKIKSPEKKSWIDREWFNYNIVLPIKNKLLFAQIVETTLGVKSAIKDFLSDEDLIYFPSSKDPIVLKKIWELSNQLFPQKTPVVEHIEEWNNIIWEDCFRFTIEELSNNIQSQGSISMLAESLNTDEEITIAFLNQYYKLLNFEKFHINEINADLYKVIPNQLGSFIKKTDLFIDEDIDDEIKNVCSIISVDPRGYLIHKCIGTGEAILYQIKKQDDIITIINEAIKTETGVKISNACNYLVSIFPNENIPLKRQSVYNYSQTVYPDDFIVKRNILNYDEKIWEESDKKSMSYITTKISDFKTVENAAIGLSFIDSISFLKWLNEFVSFLVKEDFEVFLNKKSHPILPNQNGNFCIKDDLFLDSGNIGKVLKDISLEFGYDFRKDLLDKSIYLELPENRVYDIKSVSEKISPIMKPMLRDVEKLKEFEKPLNKFYVWMNDNKTDASNHFKDLYTKRFLFIGDDEISENIKKAAELDNLMSDFSIDNIQDLRQRLSEANSEKTEKENENKTHITQEILTSLGITTQIELDEAFKNPQIASMFFHSSTHTVDMFEYAQKIIRRAKENIIAYLQVHPDYDCRDLEETAKTIFVGIIKKGVPIQIVARPSDNGEVIIYYSSEKDTLDCEDSELWVEDGINQPHILTLGRVLKTTGINRIPIRIE